MCYSAGSDTRNSGRLTSPTKSLSANPCKPSDSKTRVSRFRTYQFPRCRITTLPLKLVRQQIDIGAMDYFWPERGLKNLGQLHSTLGYPLYRPHCQLAFHTDITCTTFGSI